MPDQCPKFSGCSAPFCPLDPTRADTTTGYREASCAYLREAVKPAGQIPAAMRPQVDAVAREVLAGSAGGVYLCHVLQRASQHGSSANRKPPRPKGSGTPLATTRSGETAATP